MLDIKYLIVVNGQNIKKKLVWEISNLELQRMERVAVACCLVVVVVMVLLKCVAHPRP